MNSKIWSVPLALALACSLLLAGCGTDKKESGSKMPMQFQTPAQDAPVAVMHTNQGDISLVLFPEKAPKACENFLTHAKDGYYDGVIFHRVIEGFMIQGGDPEGTGMGGSDETIKGEFSANGVENNLSHTRGAISMARNSVSMDSASSQFFIVQSDSTYLDGQYACFGYVTSGMEIVDQICKDAQPADGNGTIPAAEQPVITAVRVID